MAFGNLERNAVCCFVGTGTPPPLSNAHLHKNVLSPLRGDKHC